MSETELHREITKVNQFMDDLPKGYDTILGDEEVRLSDDQKQRVALARTLIEDANLLILDKATSDLNSNLEKQVQQAIKEVDKEYIIITIAHRLSTVENADRIYTVGERRITETGDHRELVDSGGKYAKLYGIQSSG